MAIFSPPAYWLGIGRKDIPILLSLDLLAKTILEIFFFLVMSLLSKQFLLGPHVCPIRDESQCEASNHSTQRSEVVSPLFSFGNKFDFHYSPNGCHLFCCIKRRIKKVVSSSH